MNRCPRTIMIAFLAALTIWLNGCAVPLNLGPSTALSPGAVTGVDHILLTVSDLDRSIHFYQEVLGMQLEFRRFRFAFLKAGTFGVALSTRPWDFEKKGGPNGVGMIPHFTTPNMDEFAARLVRSGIPWLRQPVRESFGIEAFIVDPDGYQWAIVAPKDPN
ncbi:MAG: VOC family protein [Syntrophales bacterium]|nr:VOC family protein [Syntrophales bacterium]